MNLEFETEQKASVEHAVGQVARLDEMLQASQAILKSLQPERELTERIERSIKQLRSQSLNEDATRLRA